MPVDIATLKAMATAGATPDMIIAAVEAAQLADDATVAAKKRKNADRMKRVRERARTCANVHAQTRTRDGGTQALEGDSPPETTESVSTAARARTDDAVRVYKNNNSLGFEDSSQEEEKKKKERGSAEIVEGRRRESRGSRLPADWEPGPTELKFAAGEGLQGDDLRREIMKFRNHWTSKTGRDAAKLDWAATWRNWVLNANYRRGANGTGSGSTNRAGARPAGGDAVIAGLGRIANRLLGDREDSGLTGDELPFGRTA